MCNVQIAGKYDATSVANLAKRGLGTPYVLQTAHASVAKGAGRFFMYIYTRIYICTNNLHAGYMVRGVLRSSAELHPLI